MKLVGLMCCKNEDWVLGLSLRAALMWNDSMVVLLHGCTDRSAEIVREVSAEHSGRVLVLIEDDPEWNEMTHRQRMLDVARMAGATHISIVDCDEVLSGNLIDSIRGAIERIPANPVQIFQLPWVALARRIDRSYITGVWGTNWVSCAFLDDPRFHWAARDGYHFHHRHPMGAELVMWKAVRQGDGGLMHLQFLSERRLKAKQLAYQMVELLRWPGRKTGRELAEMYGRAVYQSDPSKYQVGPVPSSWWKPYESMIKHLHIDADPWQLEQVHEMLRVHGRAFFAGVDFFGIA